MKKNITLYLFSFIILFFYISSIATAQNFLWGVRGGGIGSTSTVDDERVTDMAVDRGGNIYILSQVTAQGLNVAKHAITGYGANDVILASFKPDGTLRWTKMIGNGDVDRCYWLGTDSKDGVYFSANLNKSNGAANIDIDASSPKNYQRNILVKYDTSGKFQWYRHPEMDTFTSSIIFAQTGTLAMDVGASGTVYWLMQLCPGGYGNGALKVTDTGTYLIKYSPSGVFSYSKPDLTVKGIVGATIALTVDEANNRFLLGGTFSQGTLIMGGVPLNNSIFISSFKLDGTFNWKKTSTGVGELFSRPVIDASGNIYQAGWETKSLIYNGYTASSAYGGSQPFVIKMDKDGNFLWGKGASVPAACGLRALALRNNNELVVAGEFVTSLEWPGYSTKLQTPSGGRYDVFITRFNTSNGDVMGVDRIESNPASNEYPNRMVSDGKGNVYIGGEFPGNMYVNMKDTLTNVGGQTDWFLVKYGDMWPASVQDHNTGNNVRIYPNPANEQIIIEGIAEGTTIHVMNMLGQQVLQTISKTEKEAISTSYLTPGNYILQLTNNDGSKESYRIEKR